MPIKLPCRVGMTREKYAVLILYVNNADWLVVVLKYQRTRGAAFVAFRLRLR